MRPQAQRLTWIVPDAPSAVLSSWGIGAGYNSRHYFRPVLTGITIQGATRDQDVGVYGALGRQLSRTSTVNLGAYASWYDNNEPAFGSVTSEGAQLSFQSWGTLLPFAAGVIEAGDNFSSGLTIDFQGKLSAAGSDSISLSNFTVVRLP